MSVGDEQHQRKGDTAIECDYLFPLLVIHELPVRHRFPCAIGQNLA